MTKAVEALLTSGFDGYVAELKEFCCIPSVSTDPAYADGMRRTAEWVARRLSAAGMSNVEIAQTGGHPAVLAEWMGAPAVAPTVLVYGHYDVQPPDPQELWTCPASRPPVSRRWCPWRCGPPHRSSPRSATAGSMRAVPPTTRDQS